MEDKLYIKDIIPIIGFRSILNYLLQVLSYFSIFQVFQPLYKSIISRVFKHITHHHLANTENTWILKADFLYPIIHSWSISCNW